MPVNREREAGWHRRLTYGAPLAVLLAAMLLVAHKALPILELVAIAMLLALVVRMALNALNHIGLRPWMSVSVIVGAIAAFGAFVDLVVAPKVLQEVRTLASAVPGYVDYLKQLSQRLHTQVSFVPEIFRVLERLRGYLDRALSSLPNLLLEIGGATASTVVTVILAVFMVSSPDALVSGGSGSCLPVAGARRLLGVLEERLRGWMVGTVLAMLFVGTGAGIGLWLLGAPLPITFGLLADLLNVVPYVGSIVGALLPALLALTVSPVKALLVVALFVILNQIDGYIIQPAVMGHEVRLHPVVVLLSFLLLGRLLGTVGLILAVPTLVFLTSLADELLLQHTPAARSATPVRPRWVATVRPPRTRPAS